MRDTPYVGLAPFSEDDADVFFGRDAERRRIVGNLRASRFTLLYARSGVGKSSLLRAGVVARLADGASGTLVPVIFSSWSGDPNVDLPHAIGAGGDGLEDALERATAGTKVTLLLILDQFEEFFQYHRGTPAGERFADELARVVRRTDLRAHVLVSIREDAYSRLGDAFKSRLPNVYANYLHLDYLDERAARSAIRQPLDHLGDARVSIEPRLVDRVLDEVRRDGPDGNGNGSAGDHARYDTAYLQFVMRRLWDEESAAGSDVLRAVTLERLGGAEAIVQRHLDEAVIGLGTDQQDALAEAFRVLVTPEGTKRALSAAELADWLELPGGTLQPVLDHLVGARILTPVVADGDVRRFELAHDLLAEAARDWRKRHEAARETRELSARLEAEQHRVRRARVAVAGLAALVLVMVVAVVVALVERSNARRHRDEARSQALVARSVTTLASDPERSVALARQAQAVSPTAQSDEALRQALSASLLRGELATGPTRFAALSDGARRILVEAPGGFTVWDGVGARRPVLRRRMPDPVFRTAMSEDGARIAIVTGADTQVRRLDGAGTPVELESGAGASALAFSRDGRFVAGVDPGAGRLRVWDARSGRSLAAAKGTTDTTVVRFDPADPRRVFAGDCAGADLRVWRWQRAAPRRLRASGAPRPSDSDPRGGAAACAVAVSPDGARAVESYASGSAALWDLRRGRLLKGDLLRGEDAVRDVAWSPDSQRVALAAAKSVTLLSAGGGQRAQTPAQVDWINRVRFSPDGRQLVTASRDETARVWEIASGTLVAELRGHTDDVVDAAFTPGGRDVVTVSLDGTARRWRIADGRVLRSPDWVLDAAYSPDGGAVATAAVDGTARIVPLGGGRPVPIRATLSLNRPDTIAFDRQGRRVVVAGSHGAQNGQIVVADARTGLPVDGQEFLPTGGAVLSADFSRDGAWLVTASLGGAAGLWRLAKTGFGADQPTATLRLGPGEGAVRAQYSRDGRRIVVATSGGTARVFDARTHRQVRVLRAPGVLYGAAFSPDGRRVLGYGSDTFGRVWDVRTGRLVARLEGHTSWISDGAFSRDGKHIATSSADLTTRIWDARTGKLLSTQRAHGDAVNSVAFSPDGRTILSASDDFTARLYPCATCRSTADLVRLSAHRLFGRTAAEAGGAPVSRVVPAGRCRLPPGPRPAPAGASAPVRAAGAVQRLCG